MAFNIDNLVAVSQDGTNVFDIFKYETPDDALAIINTTDYFVDAWAILDNGDIIFIKDSAGVAAIGIVVDKSAPGVTKSIDITDGMVITATDTD